MMCPLRYPMVSMVPVTLFTLPMPSWIIVRVPFKRTLGGFRLVLQAIAAIALRVEMFFHFLSVFGKILRGLFMSKVNDLRSLFLFLLLIHMLHLHFGFLHRIVDHAQNLRIIRESWDRGLLLRNRLGLLPWQFSSNSFKMKIARFLIVIEYLAWELTFLGVVALRVNESTDHGKV